MPLLSLCLLADGFQRAIGNVGLITRLNPVFDFLCAVIVQHFEDKRGRYANQQKQEKQ